MSMRVRCRAGGSRTAALSGLTVAILMVIAPVATSAELPKIFQLEKGSTSQAGVYVFVGGTWLDDLAVEDEIGDQLRAHTEVDSTPGFKTKLGYRFNKFFAVEGEVEYVPSIDVQADDASVGDLEYTTATVNGRVYVPLDDRFQFYGSLGIGLLHAEIDGSGAASLDYDDTGFAIRAGGGLDIYMTENVALSTDLSYVAPSGDVDNFDYLSIGWGVTFRY